MICREQLTASEKVALRSLALEHFAETLADPNSRLTYVVLTGEHKQSVKDAECLFGKDMALFMN